MQRKESQGLLLTLAGFALLSTGDAVVKTMAGQWPPTAIAALRYGLGAVGLAALLAWKEGPRAFAPPHARVQLLRGFSVAMATAGFFAAIFVMPLATATAITFTSPMLTAILAALVLGEPARRATWIATLIAFAGVLVVLRPNFAALGWAAVLPLASALGMSLLIVGNRAMAGKASALAMQFYVAIFATPFLVGVALAGHWSGTAGLAIAMPDWSVIWRCALVAASASTAHLLVYLGTTRAGAATVAPMSYVQLLVATGLGWWWFDDAPDAMTLAGATLIVGAGLYLWRDARRS